MGFENENVRGGVAPSKRPYVVAGLKRTAVVLTAAALLAGAPAVAVADENANQQQTSEDAAAGSTETPADAPAVSYTNTDGNSATADSLTQSVIDDAKPGSVITLTGTFTGEDAALTVSKSLTFKGEAGTPGDAGTYTATLDNVKFDVSAGASITLDTLYVKGESKILDADASAITVKGCACDLDLWYGEYGEDDHQGQPINAFIYGLNESEGGHELTLKIVDNAFRQTSPDGYGILFDWAALKDGSEISRNTFGTETDKGAQADTDGDPGHRFGTWAFRLMNFAAGATVTVSGNTAYMRDGNGAFDVYQNTTRANAATVRFSDNEVSYPEKKAGHLVNLAYDWTVANNNVQRNVRVLADSTNTYDGAPLTGGNFLRDSTGDDGHGALYSGFNVTENSDGDITGGTFTSKSNEGKSALSSAIAEGYAKTGEDSAGSFTVAPSDVEKAVASVGDSKYLTVQDAVDAAAKGQTVVLTKNTQENTQIQISPSKDITLDLKGHELTVGGYIGIGVAGKLTVTDSSQGQRGSIGLAEKENSVHIVVDVTYGGEFNLNGGTLEARAVSNSRCWAILAGLDPHEYDPDLYNKCPVAKVNITGGSIKSDMCGIQAGLGSVVTVADGEGGSSPSIEAPSLIAAIDSPNQKRATSSVTVTGGRFVAFPEVQDLSPIELFQEQGSVNKPIKICGGTFKKKDGTACDVSSFVPDGYKFDYQTGEVSREQTSSGGGSVAPSASVSAKGFSYDVSKGQLTADEVIELSGAKASNAGSDAELTVGAGQLAALNDAISRGLNGDYTVTVSVMGKSAKADVKVTLTGARSYADVSSWQWYRDWVYRAMQLGYMTGKSDTAFDPEGTLTRAEAVETLYKMAGARSVYGEPSGIQTGFTDTSDTDWYAESLSWGKSHGVVSGYPDGSFRPDAPVTREEFAKMLQNYAEKAGRDVTSRGDLSPYADASRLGWSRDAVSWAVFNRVMGQNTNVLTPSAPITRAQAAAMAVRFQPDGRLTAKLQQE